MCQYMLLTGNSTNRVKQIYLTNPNDTYPVILDVMVANIDDTYNFFNDVINQSGTSFVNLELANIGTYVEGETIVVKDANTKPLIYIAIANIDTIEINGKVLSIDDSSLGKILLHFKTENDAKQANSLFNYVLSNPNVNLNTLTPLEDLERPIIYWLSTVGASSSTDYISFNGATVGVPYGTTYGNTFSTSISFSDYAVSSQISKSKLKEILIDYVIDNRDGLITITTQSMVLTGTSGTVVDSIQDTGTYSLTFNLSDIAGNNLSGVILNLTINS